MAFLSLPVQVTLFYFLSFSTFALGSHREEFLRKKQTNPFSGTEVETEEVPLDDQNVLEIMNTGRNNPPSSIMKGDLKFEVSAEEQSSRKLGTLPGARLWDHWWQNGYYWIKVYIDPSFSSDSKNLLIKNLRSLQYRGKVVKFKIANNRPQDGQPYMHITNNDECWSWFGRTSTADQGQEVGIDENGCIFNGTIQHEILHALGFAHEHQRPDRSDYVEIKWDNIIPGYANFFGIEEGIRSLGVPYDYSSVMHYGPFDFSSSDYYGYLPTIVPKGGNTIEWLDEASWFDIVQLRLMYQCKPETGPRTKSAFEANPCTEDCPCWSKRTGCRVDGVDLDSLCKGDLYCHQNTCKD